MIKKVAIVSGGSFGIGRSIMMKLRSQGISVYNLDIHPVKTDSFSLACDITNIKETELAISRILEKENRIDILVSNAGMHASASIEETDELLFDHIVNLNLKGSFFLIKNVISQMKKHQHGKIVLISSEQAFVGKPKSAIYGATKSALVSLAKNLAIDYAEHGIYVNAVCPGTIDTPLYRQAIERYHQKSGISMNKIEAEEARTQLLNRIGQPEEVANLVAFLCSEEANFITGSAYTIDGGYTAR